MTINEEILGGLRYAVRKGESLQKAMITFYNAGYKREDIEEAARILQQEKFSFNAPMETKVTAASSGESIKQEKKEKKKKSSFFSVFKRPPKKISDYGKPKLMTPEKKKKLGKAILISAIIIAIIFLSLWIVFLIST